ETLLEERRIRLTGRQTEACSQAVAQHNDPWARFSWRPGAGRRVRGAPRAASLFGTGDLARGAATGHDGRHHAHRNESPVRRHLFLNREPSAVTLERSAKLILAKLR